MLDLADIQRRLVADGWVEAIGTLAEVSRAAALSGLSSTQLKSGQTRTVLRPYSAEDAPPRSLSAIVGLGAQPLHTDGAYQADPPDLIVLHSAMPSSTATNVWHPRMSGTSEMSLPDDIRTGVFTVRANGGISFLASAYENRRFRYDPGCMSPGDHRAIAAVSYFDRAVADAHEHRWESADQLLFIDNARTLHARAAVADDSLDRQLERLAFRYEIPK